MVTEVDMNTFTCKSFTKNDATYIVTCQQYYLSSCSCPDQLGLCKHIFLVSRVRKIPFSARTINNSNNSAAPATSLTHTTNDDNIRKQEEFLNSSSRITDKMASFFNKYKNNIESLDSMIDNMKRFENMLDSSVSPNTFNNNNNNKQN
ncbi:hypothetical protein RMATCC62417_01329 [Rhizopus microsporus]|nr:hypothetical protein RMATCC62417_01329 [Rhizopus microsporus]